MGGMAGFQYIAPNHIIKTQLHQVCYSTTLYCLSITLKIGKKKKNDQNDVQFFDEYDYDQDRGVEKKIDGGGKC